MATGLLLLYSPGPGVVLPGSGAVPGPAAPSTPLPRGKQATVNLVKLGVVLINTTIQYDGEAAAGTGMVINSDGLVLTSNHVIEDSISASPVGKARMSSGAVITADNGLAADSPDSSSRIMAHYRPGGRISVTLGDAHPASAAPAACT